MSPQYKINHPIVEAWIGCTIQDFARIAALDNGKDGKVFFYNIPIKEGPNSNYWSNGVPESDDSQQESKSSRNQEEEKHREELMKEESIKAAFNLEIGPVRRGCTWGPVVIEFVKNAETILAFREHSAQVQQKEWLDTISSPDDQVEKQWRGQQSRKTKCKLFLDAK